MRRANRFYSPSTGNAAFDEWRTAELARLDEERRKLDDAQREFAEYVEAIRRAKDREEFERFMAERRARPASGGTESDTNLSGRHRQAIKSLSAARRGGIFIALTLSSGARWYARGLSFSPGAFPCAAHASSAFPPALPCSRPTALAFAKDSVTVGMVLEPPGLDPTTAPGRGDRRDHALQYLRGPDEDQRGLLGDAAARRQVGPSRPTSRR